MTGRRVVSFVALLLATCLTIPSIAQAQSADRGTWRHTIGEQIAVALQSPDRAVQDQAMNLVMEVAKQHEGLRYTEAVPHLMAIFTESTNITRRHKALKALSATKDPTAMQALARHLDAEPSTELRAETISVLTTFLKG